jgi:hypothetical protein
VTIQNYPTVTWEATEHNSIVKFHISIVDGNVTVTCDMENFEESKHFLDLHLRAQDFVMVILDLCSFSTGKHHRLLIEKWIKPSGEVSHIYDMFYTGPQLNSAATTHASDFETLLKIISVDPPLFRALRDLIEGTMVPHASAVNCGRVLDALRKLIAPGLRPDPGWAKLRETLRVERSYLQLISDTSKDPRHGSFDRIKGDVCGFR